MLKNIFFLFGIQLINISSEIINKYIYLFYNICHEHFLVIKVKFENVRFLFFTFKPFKKNLLKYS